MDMLRSVVWGWALVLGSTAWAQVTQRVGVGANGQQGNGHSSRPLVSADGRYVVFWSHATNLGPGDEPGFADVFLRDRQLGTTLVAANLHVGDPGCAFHHRAEVLCQPARVVEIVTEEVERMSVPNEAIIETGDKRVVYVKDADNYAQREIQIGLQGELFTEITGGLKEGEQVVTFGSFFIDADHRLKGS